METKVVGHHMAEVFSALAFAAEAHKNQRRKSEEKEPYIDHPIRVANLISVQFMKDWKYSNKVTQIIQAAILHDTIEDTKVTYQDLVLHFDREVADMVQACTDDKSLPKEERKRLQLEHAKSISAEVAIIKLADKIDNIEDITSAPPAGWNLERKQEYFKWSKQFVDNLRDRFSKISRKDSIVEAVCELIKTFDSVYEHGLNKILVWNMNSGPTEF